MWRALVAAEPQLFGYNAAGVGPGGRTTGPSLGGAVAQAQARAAAQARAVAAMPLIGMGGLGASPAAAGATAANATAAPFGNRYGRPPSYGSNPFLRGITGFADGAGGGYADPGARYEGAVGQAGNALLAILKGASPTAPYDRALRHSAREAARAKTEIGATQALFDAYMPAPRRNANTAAARLAAELGVPLGAGGTAATRLGYPVLRFGMAQNPYLFGGLGADLGLGGLGAGRETAGWPPRGRGPAGWAAAGHTQRDLA